MAASLAVPVEGKRSTAAGRADGVGSGAAALSMGGSRPRAAIIPATRMPSRFAATTAGSSRASSCPLVV
jgi:hypothetical protein